MASREAIFVVTGLFPSPGTSSFAGSFVVAQLKALRRHFRPVVLVPRLVPPFRGLLQTVSAEPFRYQGVEVFYIPYFPYLAAFKHLGRRLLGNRGRQGWEQFQLEIKRYIASKLTRTAEVLAGKMRPVLVHGQEVFIGDEAVVLAKYLGVPSVVTFHSLKQFHQEAYGKRVVALAETNMHQADRLVTVSRLAAQSYPNLCARTTIIPNGYTPTPASKQKLPILLSQKLNGKAVVLYVGFFIPSKRADLLIRAFSSLPKPIRQRSALLIVGVGPEGERLKELAAACPEIIFGGEVSPQKLPAYYRAADFLVQPSVSESFSLVCLEAMAYGKPFICTSNAGIAEYVTDGHEGFVVPPDNEKILMEKIKALLTDPKLCGRMGRAARQTARGLRTERVIGKTVRLYRELIRKHGKKK